MKPLRRLSILIIGGFKCASYFKACRRHKSKFLKNLFQEILTFAKQRVWSLPEDRIGRSAEAAFSAFQAAWLCVILAVIPKMDLLSYQRIVFGSHGCDRLVADSVLSGTGRLVASENAYDWLGSGIYFWEHGPARALEWAQAQARRRGSKIKKPAVIGAVVQH